MATPRVEQSGPDVLLWIKAVPGASRDQVSGVLGDRLKIRVAAPPEAGKANAAICRMVARLLDVAASEVAVEAGHAASQKTIRIRNCNAQHVLQRLNVDS